MPRTPGLELRPDTVRMPGPGGSIVVGLLGGALGLVGGGVVGYYAGGGGADNCYESCGYGGALLGAAAGELIGLSLGVHLGNQRRGDFGGDLLGAFVVAGAVVAALVVIQPSWEVASMALAATPLLQLALVVPLERRTGVSRARRGLANR